ncbi:fluoride efflux transporter CrcB [Bacillus sp. Marseille-P3661]|uniref:fluoride efflux transporter CrcB n=1 Tax=Bacillus sp. Marseille-P3661 TaxID=1936234 RepID=UPI0015E18D36|nr:fluoride efflux transporter CrcB [Bacillus sp. Marseille-P3661]
MQEKYMNIIAVGIGGGLGAMGRYFINITYIHSDFPIATFIENIFGSLLLGFITGLSLKLIKHTWVKLALGTGFCGGFTTMSTFAADSVTLMTNSDYTLSLIYLTGTIIGSFIAVYFGLFLGLKLSNQQEVSDS